MTKEDPYNDRRWRARRAAQLAAFPLCSMCEARGVIRLATVADHLVPHRGDRGLFEGALQSLCAEHHNSDKRRIEHGGEPKPYTGPDGYRIE